MMDNLLHHSSPEFNEDDYFIDENGNMVEIYPFKGTSPYTYQRSEKQIAAKIELAKKRNVMDRKTRYKQQHRASEGKIYRAKGSHSTRI